MKKTLVTILASLIGIAASAATYNWSAESSWISPDDNDGLSGAKFYLFDGSIYNSATVMAALSTSTDQLSNALGSGTVTADGELMFYGAGITGAGDPESVSAFGIIIADGTDSKQYMYLADTASSIKITDAIKAGSRAAFAFGDIVTGEVGSGSWTAVAPEPTSGLLLLLGMAGLALKRKRA